MKIFNGKKYYYDKHLNRYRRSTKSGILLSHDVWNYYNPNDQIGDGEIIHHINNDSSDDKIENLKKMKDFDHRSFHRKGKIGISKFGKDNSNWKGGISLDIKKYNIKYQRENCSQKSLFSFCELTDSFRYEDILQINEKTDVIIITHTWRKYN